MHDLGVMQGLEKHNLTRITNAPAAFLIQHLTLSGPGGGAESAPLRFFLHNSKTPGDIEKKLSDFNFTPLMDILRILSITIVVRCCHSNLLFPVCQVIFWVEKTKKLELFSR